MLYACTSSGFFLTFFELLSYWDENQKAPIPHVGFPTESQVLAENFHPHQPAGGSSSK
jgi:hypothetical protein